MLKDKLALSQLTGKDGEIIRAFLDGYERGKADAQPERIKSKWALHTYMPHNKFCLACRNDSPYNKRWDFCPNCGADMRGEQDDKCRQV